jgi:hypothetical protein
MKTQSLINALNKQGIKVNIFTIHRKNYQALGKDYQVSWFDQDGDAICVQVRRHNDKDNAMEDYTAGFFAKTVKIVTHYIKN